MPIMLDELDLSTSTATTSIDPKFFSPKLTGSGRKAGLLNESLHPVNTLRTAYTDVELRFSQTQSNIS